MRQRDFHSLLDVVREHLRAWDPIGVLAQARPDDNGPDNEYDSYAPHILSMLVSGCTERDLCHHLQRLRASDLGLRPDPSRDAAAASRLFAWWAARPSG